MISFLCVWCSASNQRPGAAQIRLLLLRECEVRGRRLIFDSASDNAKNESGELHDDQLIKDMAFGSATLKYSGENYRFHDFGPAKWKGLLFRGKFSRFSQC